MLEIDHINNIGKEMAMGCEQNMKATRYARNLIMVELNMIFEKNFWQIYKSMTFPAFQCLKKLFNSICQSEMQNGYNICLRIIENYTCPE